jgi:hypothetical protein
LKATGEVKERLCVQTGLVKRGYGVFEAHFLILNKDAKRSERENIKLDVNRKR